MGIHVLTSDIIDWQGLSESRQEDLITVWEDLIQDYLGDLYCTWDDMYNEDYVFSFIGNGKYVMFVNNIIPYDLISISKIEEIIQNSGTTELDSDYYSFDEGSITRLDGIWSRNIATTYKVTCNIGHAETDLSGNTDQDYKPKWLREVLLSILTNELDSRYGTVEGTGVVLANPEDQFKSEKRSDFTYTRFDRNSKTPTGIPSVDFILNQKKKDKITMIAFNRRNLNTNQIAPYYNIRYE